jgi:putative ABC transport system ATP-binding protein
VLVLADEPTGNLDAEGGAVVLGLLRDATRQGRGVLVVTHDPAVTKSAGCVLALRDGRLG